LDISVNQLQVIERRFLLHDESGKVIETPAQLFRRVAHTLAKVEKKEVRKQFEDEFYAVMSDFSFLPGGRTLNNAGTPQNQLANCFVLPIEDSMEGIFDAVKWTALTHQAGGGTGFNFTPLRPRGDVVTKSSGGFATGPISFLKVFDAATRQVMQGGKQRGANMGILAVWHPDILEFITCKSEDGEISNFNISIGVTDEFMRAVEHDKEFSLRNPRTQAEVQKISARLLMDQIVSLAWRTGDPGMIFWDAINRDNPLKDSVGEILATNPCGEQPLHSFDSCNLGSINLSRFVLLDGTKKPVIDWSRLASITKTAVRMLDNVIDAGTYPLPQITDTVKQNRRIGLGVMGWADMLFQLGMPYDSNEAVSLAEKVMKHVQVSAWEASESLAEEKSPFPRWEKSWFGAGYSPVSHTYEHKKSPRRFRNLAITTIAPTGTISMAADCSSGIEPVFALSYIKNVVNESGLTYVNKYFEQALHTAVGSNGAYSDIVSQVAKTGSIRAIEDAPKEIKRTFASAHDIEWQWHVKMQAAFQKYTDNAVSKTINFPSTASIEDVRGAYLMAWKLGCKGITVYRDNSKSSQVLTLAHEGANLHPVAKDKKSKEKAQIMQSVHRVTPLAERGDFQKLMKKAVSSEISDEEACPECGQKLTFVEGCTLCPSCSFSKCSI
jgi:ribonucleoside-diphosphate reductase alpha chain